RHRLPAEDAGEERIRIVRSDAPRERAGGRGAGEHAACGRDANPRRDPFAPPGSPPDAGRLTLGLRRRTHDRLMRAAPLDVAADALAERRVGSPTELAQRALARDLLAAEVAGTGLGMDDLDVAEEVPDGLGDLE